MSLATLFLAGLAIMFSLRSAGKGQFFRNRWGLKELPKEAPETNDLNSFVGREGIAVTPLRPAGICDFEVFNTMFLPVQSIGFLLAGLGIVIMFAGRKSAALAVAPPVFRGTFVFISMMVLGLAAICASLSVLAFRMKKKGTAVLFILNLLCCMGMGYLAGKDGSSAAMNWLEQGINCVGQLCLLVGTLVLHKAGLRQLEL